MPADLAVVAIKLPSPLRAPCPVPVLVTVENMGTEAAEPVEFDVTIDLMAGESLFTFFVTLVTQPEDMAISPSRRIIVPVDVEFPCFSPVTLRATVDKQRRVPNNPMPSAPSQTITGLTPAQAPWLKTSLRVGNGDSTGLVTFPDSDGWVHTSPAGWTTFHICPGAAVVAEITVENAGCVMSKASVTEVILEEDVSPMPPIRLGSKQYVVPPLAPGTNHTFAVSLPAPISTAGPSGYLTVRASADTGMANPDQCDRAQLDAAFLSHLDRFGTPLAIQFPDAVVRPGQRPTIAALIENNCSDIGTADLRITYVGAFPTEIYRTQVAIPLQAYADIQIHPGDLKIPTTIANDFWTIGDKPLRLDLTGNGMNGGPYTVSSLLRVIPEPIETFWTWPGLAPSGTWKSSYAVSGTFTNRGSAALILSAFDALEHPTDVTGSTADVTLPAPTGAVGASVPLGASVPATWLRNQRWAWLVRGTPVEVGPRARIFSYTTSYAVVDEFGNVYPSATSAAMLVRVAVSSVKLFVLGQARELLGIGLVILGGAAAIAFVPVAGWIAGVLLGATAMALIIGATLLLYDADDPPIPDFRRGAPALFDPRNWALPDAEDERLRPLQTVALLVERVVAARVRSVQSRDLAWAAYIDREEVAVTRTREEAHHELETLRRLVQPTIDAADESEELIVQMISEIRSLPSPDELRNMANRFADEIGLEQRERALVEQRLALVDSDDIKRAFGQFRANGIRAVGDASRRIYELTAAEFAEREYLR